MVNLYGNVDFIGTYQTGKLFMHNHRQKRILAGNNLFTCELLLFQYLLPMAVNDLLASAVPP